MFGLNLGQNSSENIFSETELKFFNFFEKKEKGIDMFRPDPEQFLERVAPDRLDILRSALRKIKFKFNGAFITDLLIPMNVAGYFVPGQDILSISPMLLLNGTEKEIAHVLFHEGLHAGLYGPPIMEESIVETMTLKMIDDVYGRDDFPTGYANLVDEASEFFGDLTFEQMRERIEDGDEGTLNNILELIVVEPSLESETIKDASWSAIKSRLKKKWEMIERLFPRIVNSIAENNKGLHDEGDMDVSQFKLEGLLDKAAQKIFESKQEMIVDLLLLVTNNGKANLNTKDIMAGIIDEGFAYLYDYDQVLMDKMINLFITQVIILRASSDNGEIDTSLVNLGIAS